MKRLGILLLLITAVMAGCTKSEPSQNPVETGGKATAPMETPALDEYALVVNNVVIPLQAWDDQIDLLKILGEPHSQKIEVLGEGADTFTGSFIKTMAFDGLHMKLFSPKQNGKTFWIMEMAVSKKGYRTSKGIEIGDAIDKAKSAYSNLEIKPDGRTDPNNCAYVIQQEQMKYLEFEVKDGLVSEIKLYYLMP